MKDWRRRPKIGEKVCDCGQRIIFVLTEEGKRMPVDPDTGVSHWETCPLAKNYRKSPAKPKTKSQLDLF